MSIKKVSKEQPDSFEFNEENLKIANDIIKNYPSGKQQSAVMSFLYLAQRPVSYTHLTLPTIFRV